ncbi:hypothetical protein FG386_000479, partial [Cryptosporidium ryanae]|uniref:uncharacterized protein n=1 Tax=Cryptosporidium ryanae TaxID=515981 RepID=UPI00351A717A
MSEIPLKGKIPSPPLSKGILPSKNLNDTSGIKKSPPILLQKNAELKVNDSPFTKQVVAPSAKIIVSTKPVVGKKMVITDKKLLPAKEQSKLPSAAPKTLILKKEADASLPSTLNMKATSKIENKLDPKIKNNNINIQATGLQSKLDNQVQTNSGLPQNNMNETQTVEKQLNKVSGTSSEGAKLLNTKNIHAATLSPILKPSETHNLAVEKKPVKSSYNEVIPKNNELPLIHKDIQNNTTNIDNSNIPNMQLLDPAIWQMVTTIATICSTACQNNHRATGRHCCRRRHSRKDKKENDSVEKNMSNGTKESPEVNELQRDDKQEVKEKVTEKKNKIGNQYENIVSGTKWHGIEKKLANIRGLRDLSEVDNGSYDDELMETDNDFSKGVNQPRYYEEDEFPSEISTRGNNRRYLAKEGVYKSSRFSKSPFVGGLSAARRRPYSSLTEMAAYFSNIEPQDQNDVIVMLLACRKLEKQIEEQQVIMQLLEHDLKEAQSLLRFPPEWRSLNSADIVGHSPLPIGQIPPTNDPPYVSNHPGAESPWLIKRPKEG